MPRFFPAAGAVEYAIDYTTDRGGSRCLRLIPIPRNHRCRPRVRFNIFDRYPVCSLRPIIPPYTHTHKYTHTHIYIYPIANYHPVTASEIFDVDELASCFRNEKSLLRAICVASVKKGRR